MRRSRCYTLCALLLCCMGSPVQSSCAHCAADRTLATQLKLNAIKQQILSKLNLADRPNITVPAVPREVALEALRRVDRDMGAPSGDPDGDYDEDEEDERRSTDEFYGKPSEIIAFAEPGAKVNGHVLLTYRHQPNRPERLRVNTAILWLYVRISSQRLRTNRTTLLYIFRVANNTTDSNRRTNSTNLPLELIATHQVKGPSGWRKINVQERVQKWFEAPRHEILTLLVDCVRCDGGVEVVQFATECGTLGGGRATRHRGGNSSRRRRPFLSIATSVKDEEGKRRSRRYAPTCGKNNPPSEGCCRQSLYVDFKQLGWSDWIIAPSGYNANYCVGDCMNIPRTPDTFHNFHSHIIEEYRSRNPYASITPCCAPTKLSSMSLIYYDPEQNIIKADLPKMIVDECGCT